MSAFADLVRFIPTLGGTTDWVYSSAVGGCQSPSAANVVNGGSYKVYAVSNDLTQWEVSTGVYVSSTGTFPRTTVLYNSSGTGTATGQSGAGTKISFSTVPQVSIVGLAEDLIPIASSIGELQGLDTTAIQVAFLNVAGREGQFVWRTGDHSALVTSDTQHGIYIAATAVASTSGAWERVHLKGSVDVRWFGALADGLADYTTQCQCAINVVQAIGNGEVLFPGAFRCDVGLTVGNYPISMRGLEAGGSSIYSTTANTTVVYFNGNTRGEMRNLLVYSNTFSSSACAALRMTNCVQTKIDNCWLQGCYYNIWIDGTATSDCIFTRNTCTYATGTVMAFVSSASGVNGGHHFWRNLFNQAYVFATPTSSKFKGARVNTTAYSAGDIVTVGSYYFGCTVGGTSGGSTPANMTSPVFYLVNITDGGATFQLMGNTSYQGIQLDSNTSYITVRECDFTGPFSTAITISNSLSSTAPLEHNIENNTAHGPISNGLYVSAGTSINIEKLNTWNATGTGTTYGILLSSNNHTVIGCQCYGFTYGCYFNFNYQQIIGNVFIGNTNGIGVAANVTSFTITGNNCGYSASRGANTNSIVIAAGTSDFYSVTNNIVVGAINPVSDGGSGTHKTVSANW